MKTKDLMLQDWVSAVTPFGSENHFVMEIYQKGITVENGNVFLFDEIEPIAITPEALEKNGFEKYEMYYILKIDEDFEIWYYPHLGSLRYEYRGELIFKSMDGLNYIHQLQHVLRLCGIDKEIEL